MRGRNIGRADSGGHRRDVPCTVLRDTAGISGVGFSADRVRVRAVRFWLENFPKAPGGVRRRGALRPLPAALPPKPLRRPTATVDKCSTWNGCPKFICLRTTAHPLFHVEQLGRHPKDELGKHRNPTQARRPFLSQKDKALAVSWLGAVYTLPPDSPEIGTSALRASKKGAPSRGLPNACAQASRRPGLGVSAAHQV